MSLDRDTSVLTPIKIPGKRHRKPASGSEPNKRRKPGRPRRVEQKQPRAVGTKQSKPQHKNLEDIKSKRKRSTIENLPTEVLENIFLHSMNFNLPRSSPVLAGRLSSNYIYTQTIMNVLGDPWKLNFRDRAKYRDFGVIQAYQDQTSLLKCRWVTVPLLQEARRRWLVKNFSSFQHGEIARRYSDHKSDFLKRHPEYEDKANWPDTLEATLHIDEDLFGQSHSLAVKGARPFNDNGEPQLCRGLAVSDSFSQDLDTAAYPPEHTLKGPWTQDKLLHLFWLAWAGLSLDSADSTILPEVASQGLQDAIQEGNLQAIAFLQLVGMSQLAHEDIFKALATTPASNKAILIVRVLDLFLCGSHKSSPKGTWEHWVEDIIKMSGQGENGSERDKLMKATKAEVYDYARRAYENVNEYWEADYGKTEQVMAVLSRST